MENGINHPKSGGSWYYGAAAYILAVGMAGTTLPTPLYDLYQEKMGFSSLVVTAIFAAYAAGVIAVLVLAGNFSDVMGRRPLLLAALAFAVLSAICFLLADGLPLLFLGRVLSGFSAGVFTAVGTVTILELAPQEHHGRASFTATAANMLGLGCGPLLAGILAQYAPWPLRLPYLAHLGLVTVAIGLTLALPETVRYAGRRPPLRFLPPGVPAEVRPVFLAPALAAFVGFAMLGLFTAVAPSFMTRTLGIDDLAVSGAVVFTAFAASTAGQAAMSPLGARRALPLGCLALVVGVAFVAGSLLAASLPLLVVGTMISGLGQGLLFRSGLTSLSRRAPAHQRAQTTSAFFVAAYLGISLPVVGVGGLSEVVGLRDAGIVFSACAMVLAGAVGCWVARRPPTGATGSG